MAKDMEKEFLYIPMEIVMRENFIMTIFMVKEHIYGQICFMEWRKQNTNILDNGKMAISMD